MELVSVIRHKVLTEGVPIRDVARQLGLSRNTIRRYVRAKVVPVPRPRSPPRAAPAREQVAEAAAAIWASRRTFTAGKQQLTATRLWELLRDDGHDVGARTLEEISTALQARIDAQHARDPARTAAWEDERRALRAVPEPFDGRQVRSVQLRHHASHAVAGGHYSIPSRWCGHTVDLFVGTNTVSFARGDEVVCHPRVPFGGRSVDYRHLLLPLSRKPQALRQVVHELVAQFGQPWPALWEALRACYAPDEIEAARRLAPWLERADRQGLARIAPRIRAAIADGTLVSPPHHNVGAEDLAEVPAALRLYAIEAPDLRRYDALLEAARCSA